jgi:asparagine synthase (glutamine-hydrolysing)
MLSDLKSLVSDAVAMRCDNRFAAGAHTSGGLDSGIVSALARKGFLHQEDFYGFSWSPAEFTVSGIKYDERDLVRLICRKANIIPVFSDMTASLFRRHVEGFYDNQGYFFEERTMEQAVRKNTNLIFSGWGGDEFISTGDRGIETDLLSGFKLKTYFRRNHLRPLKKFLKYFLQYTLFPALGMLQKKVSKSFENEARYIRPPLNKSDKRAISNFYFHISRRQMHLRYLEFYHLQERCESWAIFGYRNGVEYRYPLLDKRIIEYMLRVPSELLCKTDFFRPLLRVIGEGILPLEVLSNTSKKDPVYSAFWDELLRVSAGSLMEETDAWTANRDLGFVNFNLLKTDILKYKDGSKDVDVPVLYRALVYIKAIHEFTLAYRNHI